jgi:hypothetical protein
VQGFRSDTQSIADMVVQGYSNRRIAEEAPAAYMRNANGVEQLRAAIYNVPKDPSFVPRTWQAEMLRRLAEPANDRQFFWVQDTIGGKGKSRFTRHLVFEYGAVQMSGKINDMAYLFKSQPIIIFDITRAAAEKSDHFYTFMEMCKNQSVVSNKYVPVQKFSDKPPHVIFFSNSPPDHGKFSADRLVLINLDNPNDSVYKVTIAPLLQPQSPVVIEDDDDLLVPVQEHRLDEVFAENIENDMVQNRRYFAMFA